MTLGYLTSDFNTGYGLTLWQGLKETCQLKGINVLFFDVGVIKSPNLDQFMSNVVLDFIDADVVDGLIVNVATIFHYTGKDEIEAFYRRYPGIPTVDIGFEIEDHPTVLVDNKSGIVDGVTHLIKNHACRKIAFIKGPGFNTESSLRYEAYIETLRKHGIEPDTELIEEGDFFRDSGAICFERLWKKDASLDAVVASNDSMAFGVLQKAQELGISVPNELAVTGFDDIAEAAKSSIPLTTVRQPLSLMAKKAVDLVVDLIEGKVSPRRVVLPTELVIRKSCGCLSRSVQNARLPEAALAAATGKTGLSGAYDAVLERVKRAIAVSDDENPPLFWPEKLVRSFVDCVGNDDDAAFLSVIDKELNKAVVEDSFDIEAWQDALSELTKATLPYLSGGTTLVKAESFWQSARVLIQEAGIHSQSYAIMQNELASETRRRINSELISSFDLAQLVETMSKWLPRLGVNACYMSLFGGRGDEAGYSEYSTLILGYNGGVREEIPPQGIRFQTKKLLPEGLTTSDGLRDFIIEALYFQKELFGFMLLRADARILRLQALRQQISSTLKGALLVREVRDKGEKLETLLAEQRERAKELENAYKVLKENQEKMLIIEKMASLGRMTAGIAHEMNTPLAAVRNVLVELESLAKEYDRSIGDPDVGPNDHREIVSDMSKALSIGKKAAERAASFIQSVKSQTTGLSPQDRRIFDAIPVVQDAILLMSHSLKKNACSVNFSSVAGRVELFGSAPRLSQVIINLLTNAIDAYKGKGGGPISISLCYEKDGANLTIADNGSGIEKDVLPKIFDPLFTTKPFSEGTGLGLTIVRDIVTGEFEGTIDVASEAGIGTSFILHLPKVSQGVGNA
jgi:DNA-binding LacI/PurR family transcriptional regulator/signal transduction histidine kinase